MCMWIRFILLTKLKKTTPGKYPFTRGIHAGMYRDRLWTMRQYSGFGDASQTNKRFKFMLEKGQTGLSMAFDLPTQIGYDPDAAVSEGEVGKVGVSIASLDDMMTAFKEIPLGKVSTSMTINSTASTLLAYYIVVGESQGYDKSTLRGTTQNDILKEYIARNTYIYPPIPSMRLIGDMIEYCSNAITKWYPISISGYHMREAGATAIQEIAFTIAKLHSIYQDMFEPWTENRRLCSTIIIFSSVVRWSYLKKLQNLELHVKFMLKYSKIYFMLKTPNLCN